MISITCVIPQAIIKMPKQTNIPVGGQVATLRNKINKRKRDDEVSGRNQKIRDQMQPHQAGIPQVAVAMRHETVLTKETPEKVHTSQTNFAGSAAIPSSTRPFPPAEPNPWHRLCHAANCFIAMTQA